MSSFPRVSSSELARWDSFSFFIRFVSSSSSRENYRADDDEGVTVHVHR